MPNELHIQRVSNAAPEVDAQTRSSRISRFAGVIGLSAMLALLGGTACDDGGGSGDESGANEDEAGNEEEAGEDEKGNEEEDGEEDASEEEESGGDGDGDGDGDEVPPEFKGKENDNKEDKIEEAIEAGKELYAANACKGCHGDKGEGVKGIGSQLAKKDDPLADDYFLFRVMKGVEDTAMTAYESSLDESQVWDILSFIRSHEK